MLERGTHFVDVDGLETFVNIVGQGAPVFVVHGGPGFSHDYLIEPLARLADRRQLIFYDQPGCGQTPSPGEALSPSFTFSHLRSLVQAITGDNKSEILAHSWGSLVVLGAIASDGPSARNNPMMKPQFSGGLLINPVASTSANYELARLNLLSRIPESVLLEVEKAAMSEADGGKIMELILPYYYVDIDTIPSAPFALAKGTYLSVNAQLTDFDFADRVSALGNVSIALGEQDFTMPEHIEDMISACRQLHLLKSAGHFPFDEKPAAFEKVLDQVFI